MFQLLINYFSHATRMCHIYEIIYAQKTKHIFSVYIYIENAAKANL